MPQAACPDISDLEPFVNGELSGDSWHSIQDHLSSCPECQNMVAELTANLRMASALRENRMAHWAEHSLAPPETSETPELVGEFQILREIGRGGMGVVYEAQQGQPRRKVALKFLNCAGRFNDRYDRLFRREVQALARLKHSAIAGIYAAGRTTDGRPYLAMELVEGARLQNWAAQPDIDLRQKLAMFQRIVAAVSHAHQRGVIHLDLKPSNIVVDQEGQPKVLDFGLARLLRDEDEADSVYGSAITEVGRIQGTLPYMSPEQASGNSSEIDVRSDVYSLGVILYELLTGKLPYEADWSRLPGAVRTICEQSPTRPSSVNRALRGDLETIILKSLGKEPSRRYASASALGDDITRYLGDQPIMARQPTAIYQLRKLMMRHRVTSALTAITLMSLIVVGIWLTFLYRQANELRVAAERARRQESEQRRLAELNAADAAAKSAQASGEADRADAISTFLTDMLASPDPTGKHGREVTVARVLTVAATELDAGAMQSRPEIEAAVRLTLGGSFRALEMFAEAESQLLRALEICEQIGGTTQRLTADIVGSLGVLYRSQGRITETESAMRRALAIRRELFGDHSLDVATSLNNLSVLLQDQGKMEEGEALAIEVLAIRRALLPETDTLLPMSLNNLGIAQERLGKLEEAAENYRQAIELHYKHGVDHPYLATALNNLGILRSKQNRHAEALERLHEGLAMRRRIHGEAHSEIANSLSNVASALVIDGRAADAEPFTLEALEMAQRILPEGHWYLAVLKYLRGECLTALGRFDEAEEILLEGFTDIRPLGERHSRTRRALKSLVDLYAAWEKPDQQAEYQAQLDAALAPSKP